MSDVNDLAAGMAKTTWEAGIEGTTVTLTVENTNRPLSDVEFILYELLRDRLYALLEAPEKMLEDES